MMAFLRKSRGPVLRTITIGNPWRIDGESIEARDAQAALRQIYDEHELFPVYIDVKNPSGPVLNLTMDENGATTHREDEEPADDEQDLATDVLQGSESEGGEEPELVETEEDSESEAEEPAREEQPESLSSIAAVTKNTSQAPSAEDPEDAQETAAAKTPVGDGAEEREPSETEEGSQRRWSRTALVITGAAIVVFGLGAVGVNALVQDNESSAETSAEIAAPEQAVTLGEDATPIWLSDRVAVVDDGGSIRLIDPVTGDQIGDDIDADAGKVRAMSSESGDVITTGEGQFIIYDGDNDPQTYDGTLNLRGTEPVAVDGQEFRTMDAPESTQDAPDDAAVFGATRAGVVMAKAPATTIVGDAETNLSQPHDDAEVIEWVQATDDAYALLWSPVDDGKPVLALHHPETGEVMSKTEVSEDEVRVSSGTVSVGDERYLEGTEVKDLCSGGSLVNGNPVCPTDTGAWETADGAELTGKPRAMSESYYVTPNNEVREIEQ